MTLFPPSSHQFVCIAGLHRSGTSLLHEILREHPQMSGFSGTGVPEDEGQHLQTVFQPAKNFGGPGRFAFNPDAYLDEHSALLTHANQQKLWEEWSKHWDLSRSILLEKSPPNLIRLRFLQAMFPGMKAIIVLRHPIAVSLATQKWSGTSLNNLLSHWETAHRQMLKDLSSLSSYIIVRYEDLVTSPEATLLRIHAYLGTTPHNFPQTIDPSSNARYFERWRTLWREQPFTSLGVLARHSRRYHEWGYRLTPPFVLKEASTITTQPSGLMLA